MSERENSAAGGPGRPSTEDSAEADDGRLGPEFARLTAKLVGRAREEAEDIWAEAQSVRQEEPSALRRTATYGLGGLLKAGDAIAAGAREVAAQARGRAASAGPEETPGSRDAGGPQLDGTRNVSPAAKADHSPPG